jgi:hypothetical protein
MREQIKLPENSKKYSLPEKNIIELDGNSVIRKKNRDYYAGLAEEGIIWPVEIQGGGRSCYEKKQFEVAYPVGDIFLSSAVTFHELGHLRQGEADQRFTREGLGSPNPKESGETEGHDESEQDAWQRGLARAEKYCPEYLTLLEEKFQRYKKRGKFEKFASFKDFYEYVVKVSLKITDFNDEYEKEKELTDEAKGRVLGKMIKGDELTNDFFTNQKVWRSGENVDRKFAKKFVKKMAERIAEEVY